MTNQLLTLIWRTPETDSTDFAEALVAFARSRVDTALPVTQCNIADQHVRATAELRQGALDPAPEALVRVTGAAATADPAAAYDEIEAALASAPGIARVAGFAVATREPRGEPSAVPGAATGERSEGWSQVALLRRAPGMDTDAFLDRWLEQHTKVALDIQSTFRYVQHIVEATFGDDVPALDGIVEECFPTGAMNDPHVFFATGGDADVLDERINTMVASVSAFLDLSELDVIPTSEYRFDR